MQFAKLSLFLFFVFGSSLLFSQSSSNALASSSEDVIEYEFIDIGENWKFYLDEENKAYFIDFEALGGNLTDLKLKDKKGLILFEEDLLEIPSNTIYELDLASYGSGEFVLEIRTYSNTIHSNISIK